MGGELKATFCLVKDGQAILSQHQGDLEHPAAFDDYRKNLRLYARSVRSRAGGAGGRSASRIPRRRSSRARWRMRGGLPLIEVQHHHAHIAACLAENGRALGAPPVLGIALDGLGWAKTGRSGAASSCSPIIAATQRLATLCAGRDARRRQRDARAVARPLCAPRPRHRLGRVDPNRAGSELCADLSCQAARQPSTR